MIAPKQIETALGLPDPSHVPERLQDGVDGAQLRRAAGADGQLGNRRRSSTASRGGSSSRRRRPGAAQPEKRARFLGFETNRVASGRGLRMRQCPLLLTPPRLPATDPRRGPRAPVTASRAPPIRMRGRAPQYLELKANVHRKLLNRLNLEALAHGRPRARRERDPDAALRAASPRKARRSASPSASRS